MRARRARESQEQTTMRLSQVAQLSALTQASQSQERVTCLAGKAAFVAIKAQDCTTGNRDTFLRRASKSRDAAATATARTAETKLRRSVRNARNAATTARSKAAETFYRRRARQFRDAGATARSRESETELQRATRNARNSAATSAARNSEGPQTRADRLTRAAINMAAVRLSQTPQALRICLDGDIQHLSGARGVTCPHYNLQAETRIGILPPSGRVPRREIILLLQAMLHEVNSYIRSFKYALENVPIPSFSIVIDAEKRLHDEHERRYNSPPCNEVASIIHGE
ncbi:unnamed protein product [Acanthosepion pharaonis]|uniref:Uncharacterized protein n=1 Tax=Acanthosepion pharaonis TaxID=158019 RepID=A0A812CZ64_ACAPH|nr:unnamed protein product [Sepia pharaonis]